MFNFQHPHGGLQPSVTPGSETPKPSFGLHRFQAHSWYKDMHAGKTPIHIKIKS